MHEEESIMTIDQFGHKKWRNKQGEFHRLDGPAIEYTNETKEWWYQGLKHRLDGPAIECKSGTKLWYKYGKLHCISGPAVQCMTGAKNWWIRGQYFETKEAFFEALTPEEKEIAIFSEDFHNA